MIAIEDRAGFVPGHLHRHSFWNTSPHHVPHRRPSKVVRDITRETGGPASPVPRLVVVRDRLAVVVEHQLDELPFFTLQRELSIGVQN
jgi:hypothetical protein